MTSTSPEPTNPDGTEPVDVSEPAGGGELLGGSERSIGSENTSISEPPSPGKKHGGKGHPRKKGDTQASWQSEGLGIAGVIGELFLTLAVVCALYILWQLWWTGVISEQTQEKQAEDSSWVTPASTEGSFKIAKPQEGEVPIDDSVKDLHEGDVVSQLYIPRFGATWKRLIVEGTTPIQLARHGLGHYPGTELPGELGNFAVAGHRSGYGEPLGNVPDLQVGDAIVVRTDKYWYIYEYTSHEIVLPSQTSVVAAVPNRVGEIPTERFITLTTCEPRYTASTHRWISYGKMKYWALVSDGIPQELATPGANGAVEFTQNNATWTSKIPSLTTLLLWLIIAYLVLYIAGAIVWRYPATRRGARKLLEKAEVDGEELSVRKKAKLLRYERSTSSLYGWIFRHHPGISPVRWVLMFLLAFIGAVALFEWAFPWMAANIPFLQVASSYVSVG